MRWSRLAIAPCGVVSLLAACASTASGEEGRVVVSPSKAVRDVVPAAGNGSNTLAEHAVFEDHDWRRPGAVAAATKVEASATPEALLET